MPETKKTDASSLKEEAKAAPKVPGEEERFDADVELATINKTVRQKAIEKRNAITKYAKLGLFFSLLGGIIGLPFDFYVIFRPEAWDKDRKMSYWALAIALFEIIVAGLLVIYFCLRKEVVG
jgi:hypothetical protein